MKARMTSTFVLSRLIFRFLFVHASAIVASDRSLCCTSWPGVLLAGHIPFVMVPERMPKVTGGGRFSLTLCHDGPSTSVRQPPNHESAEAPCTLESNLIAWACRLMCS